MKARGRQAVDEQVLPALRRLRAFVADEYWPAAPPSGALATYPGGADVYAHEVRSNTTTELGPAQIHAIGLRELARLRGEMEAVMKEVKFEGDFAAFVRHLNTEAKFFRPQLQPHHAIDFPGPCRQHHHIDIRLAAQFA